MRGVLNDCGLHLGALGFIRQEVELHIAEGSKANIHEAVRLRELLSNCLHLSTPI